MLRDLLGFVFQTLLKSARARRAAALCALAGRAWDRGDMALVERQLRKAIRIDPESARIATNLGTALVESGRPDEGLALLRKAIELDPAFADARVNLAIALYLNSSTEESVGQYREAIRLDPENSAARLNILMPLLESCDWDGVAAEVARLMAARSNDAGDVAVLDCVDPFLSLLLPLPQPFRLGIARHHSGKAAKRAALGPRVRRAARPAGRARLRFGYVSNGFQEGATAHLIAGMIERHDRSRFEIYAYSLGQDDGGEYRRRLINAFDHFVDIRPLSHHEAAQRMADDGIDILVDLMGFQADGRPELAELRPAPVQVSFLGYPGTLGTQSLDYIFADRIVLPEGDLPHYSEKVVWMPDCYQVNDHLQRFAGRPAQRTEHGLPEGFVFCSFNQHSKIERAVFELWLRILAQVKRSVLWLQAGPGEARLRARASQAGIDSRRLVFASNLPKPEHLERLRLAGLCLDTYTYNGHTTSSDALWAGVPVLTCPAEGFAGRVSASLLHAIGLPEMICADFAAYERQAVALARDPVQLGGIREKLNANRLTHPLYDTEKFTRGFESACEAIWHAHRTGAAPRSFSVDEIAHIPR